MSTRENPRPRATHANPEYARAMRELRRSNAAGTHDNRPRRERTRGAARRAAVRRQFD